MPAARSTSGAGKGSGAKRSGAGQGGGGKTTTPRAKATAKAARPPKAAKPARAVKPAKAAKPTSPATLATDSETVAAQLSDLAEQVTQGVVSPRDLVVLTRDRIQQTLDEAAERGRVTRTDANMLVSELVRRGRQQTGGLLAEIEQLLDRGRDQIGSVTRRARDSGSVEKIVRGADRARRSAGVGPGLPILGYDELTSTQVCEQLGALSPAELRKLHEHERRHANRKSVLDAVERALD